MDEQNYVSRRTTLLSGILFGIRSVVTSTNGIWLSRRGILALASLLALQQASFCVAHGAAAYRRDLGASLFAVPSTGSLPFSAGMGASDSQTPAQWSSAGLIGSWSFEEGTGTTTADASGLGGNGTLVNSVQWAPGKIGNALTFTGSQSYVRVANFPTLTSAVTASAWIYPTGPGSDASYTGGIIVNKEGEWELARFPDGTIRYCVANASPGWNWQNSGYVAPLNQWTHVVFVYSSQEGEFKVYANGALVHSRAGSGVIGDVTTSMNELWIGGRQASNQFFCGEIDEVQVFNRPLTASEVSIQASSVVSLLVSPRNPSMLPNQIQSFLARVVGTSSMAVTWELPDPDSGSISSDGYYVAPSSCLAANRSIRVVARSTADPSRSDTVIVNLSWGLVGSWAFEEGTGTTTADASGLGGDGTLVNSVQWAPGKVGNALTFSGSQSYVRVANFPTLTSAVTASVWIYPTGPGSDASYTGGIIVNKEGEWEFARFPDGTIRYCLANASPGWNWQNSGYVAPLNQWTHVVFVYSSQEGVFKVYANGALVHSRAGSGTIGDVTTSMNELWIGGRPANNQFFNGKIDEVRVFDFVLNAAEISALFNAGSGGNAEVVASLRVSPNQISLRQGSQFKFGASVIGTGDKRVDWAVLEATGGVIASDGLYQTPTTTGQYTVRATSTANPALFANAVVSVGIPIVVSPTTSTVVPGGTQAFAATLLGIPAGATPSWRIQEPNGGTITAMGFYTAPLGEGTFTVEASATGADGTLIRSTSTVVVQNLDVSGTWTDSYSQTFTLFQTGAQVTGIRGGNRFQGTLTGYVLNGTQLNPDGSTQINFIWTFDATGNSYTGLWGNGTATPGTSWSGTRKLGVVSVQLAEPSLILKTGDSHQFSAFVAGSPNKSVTWAVSGGQITPDGAFNAPSVPGNYTVTATSLENNQACGTGAVMVTTHGALEISGYYTTTAYDLLLFQNGNQIEGDWYTENGGWGTHLYVRGTLDGYHLLLSYYSPSAPQIQGTMDLIFALDGKSFTGKHSYYGTWNGTRQPKAVVQILPPNGIMAIGGTKTFTSRVAGVFDRTVAWSATGGQVGADGNYRAGQIPGNYTITATSLENPQGASVGIVNVSTHGALEISGYYITSQYDLLLFQNGAQIEGDWYTENGGWGTHLYVRGTLDGYHLLLSYYSPSAPQIQGTMDLTFAADGTSFTGKHSYYGVWNGARKAGVLPIRIMPGTQTLFPSEGFTFVGKLAGAFDKRLQWSVVESAGGTVAADSTQLSATYHPGDQSGTFTVKAAALVNSTQSATVSVTVKARVLVTPEFVELKPSVSTTLRANVQGNATKTVTWSIKEGAVGGSLAGGTGTDPVTYTAPSAPGNYHVMATSTADATLTAVATIRVGTGATLDVVVNPAEIDLPKGGTTNFTAAVSGGTSGSVTWSCTGGTINASTGAYSAPTAFGTYTVRATSTEDSAAFGAATITVKAQAGADQTFTYDLNGNMTSDGNRTFEWDAENRLVSVTILATGHRSEFGYDGMGRRVVIRELDPDASQNLQVTSDRKYLWDGVEIAQERSADGGTVLRQFYAQGFVDTDGAVLFYARDHLGSIRELTDGTQTVQARYDFDPYGRMSQISGSRNSPFGYTGHFYHEPSGLDLTLYRAYDPNLGQWLSRDPVGERGSINLYQYVSCNTVNFNDYYGLCQETPGLVLICKLGYLNSLQAILEFDEELLEGALRDWEAQNNFLNRLLDAGDAAHYPEVPGMDNDLAQLGRHDTIGNKKKVNDQRLRDVRHDVEARDMEARDEYKENVKKCKLCDKEKKCKK